LESGAVPTEAAEERNPPERRVDLPRIERPLGKYWSPRERTRTGRD
jgi:hypothetical protein